MTDSNSTTDIPAAPTISPAEVTFLNDVRVILTGPDGTTVYYTTDNTLPSIYSVAYTAPFVLTRNTLVLAVAVNADGETSDVVARLFTKQRTGPWPRQVDVYR